MRRVWLAAVLVGVLASGTAASAGSQPGAASAPLRIWPLGDSITQGALGPSTGVAGGYRGFLDAALQSAGVEHQMIGSMRTNSTALLDARGQAAHDGHPAFYIDEVTAGVAGHVDAHKYRGGNWVKGLDPDLVLLHIGTNDVIHRLDPQRRFPTRDGKVDPADPSQRVRFVADLTARLQRLLEEVHRLRPRAAIVVATIPPVGADSCDQVTPDYARSVRRLVMTQRAAGLRIGLADVWSAYTRADSDTCVILPGLLSQDRVHPTSAGYAVMAAAFEQAIAGTAG